MKNQKIFKWLLLIGLLLAILLVWVNRYGIYDRIRLYGYNPPSSVTALATDTTMTGGAKHIFYVNRPSIEGKQAFNDSCPNNGGEQTIVLGCYHSGETGIFIYSVNDPKLNGVEQVTAAHEMLHAAYERLSAGDKAEVDNLLQDFYKNNLHDSRLLDTINAYQKSEPGDVVNEMHSIFGTEVPNLPPQLENYYKRYFVNRAQVVTYTQAYQANFTSLQAQAANILSQINATKQKLDAMKSEIDAAESSLNTEYQNLQATRSTTTDKQAYNNEVDVYNSRVSSYRSLIKAYNSLVAQYNQLILQYRAIAVETNQLYQELNSRSPAVQNQ